MDLENNLLLSSRDLSASISRAMTGLNVWAREWGRACPPLIPFPLDCYSHTPASVCVRMMPIIGHFEGKENSIFFKVS